VGYQKVLENFLWGSGKVLDFFVSKKAGTLCLYYNCSSFYIFAFVVVLFAGFL